MKNLALNTVLLFCGLIFIFNKSYSQDPSPEMNSESRSHLGIAVGVMNYSGFMDRLYHDYDGGYSAGSLFTLNQASISGEVMYRYDFTDKFHVRATGMFGQLKHDNVLAYTAQGSFKTNIAELSILPEYDFIDVSTNEWHYRYKWTPYIFGGPGVYKLFSYTANGAPPGNRVQLSAFNFRWGIGVKYSVTPDVQLFLEGSRREYSKQIDFFNNHAPSRYYSVMIGGEFSLQRRRYTTYW